MTKSPICDIPSYTVDKQIQRNNRDSNTVEEHGKVILEICKSNSLRILNIRTKGDEFGRLHDTQSGRMKTQVL